MVELVAGARHARHTASGAAVPLDQDLMPDRARVAALVARQDPSLVAIGE